MEKNNTSPDNKKNIIVITLDGNIGVGKSTFLKYVSQQIPEVEIVLEPVGVWENLKCENDKSLLTHFYEDSKRWGYTFQNCAILTRILELRETIKKTNKRIIITERSVLTDKNVFAKMNKDIGNINKLEWDLYNKWFDGFSDETPIDAAIYITTSPSTANERIKIRNRNGESNIPFEYLKNLDLYHKNWLNDNKDMPVLKISTEENMYIHENIEKLKKFIEILKSK